MGNSLPLLSKEIIEHDVGYFKSAACSMQGLRSEMEDALVCVTEFPKFPHKWFVGVFDGHSGAGMSRLLSRDLFYRLNEASELSESEIRKICIDLDKHYMENQRSNINGPIEGQPGSTAVFAIIEKQPNSPNFEILACNIGDSRIILVDPVTGKHTSLTEDHKPENPIELARITHAGGFVQASRVDGSLALSRAFGDALYKNNGTLCHEEQKVIPVPDFIRGTGKAGDLLIVACDGVFEACETDEVVDFVNKTYKNESKDVSKICPELVNYCISAGSNDNISCQIISFESTATSAVRTSEYYLPGVYFNSGSRNFKESFFKECIHMGLNPDEVRSKSIASEEKKCDTVAIRQMCAAQSKANVRIPLSRDSSEFKLIALPRPVAEFDAEFEQFTDCDEDENNDQIINLIRTAISGGVQFGDNSVMESLMAARFGGDNFDVTMGDDDEEDEDEEEEEDDEDDDAFSNNKIEECE